MVRSMFGDFRDPEKQQHLLRIYGTTDIDPLLLLLSSDVGYFGDLDDYWKCFFKCVVQRIRPERDSFQFAQRKRQRDCKNLMNTIFLTRGIPVVKQSRKSFFFFFLDI